MIVMRSPPQVKMPGDHCERSKCMNTFQESDCPTNPEFSGGGARLLQLGHYDARHALLARRSAFLVERLDAVVV